MAADPKIITALDFPAESDALELAERLDPQSTNLKVGNELFTAAGPKLVRNLQGMGFRIFLDLKFHDIPNTVASALRAAVDLGVWMTNIHASGGRRMLDAARAAVPAGGNTKLIAVTVLTSTSDDELSDCGVHGTIDEQVLRLAALTRDSGLDGVVCSPQESTLLRRAIGDDFLLVTPGVRPQGSAASDQRRVMTPRAAIDAGSDYLVIGRPITQAKDPPSVLASIMDTLNTKRVRS